MRRFSAALGLSRGSATAMADRLVRLGLVQRRLNERDRREVQLEPTLAGISMAQQAENRRELAVRALARRFDEGRMVPLGDCVLELIQLLGESAEEVEASPTDPA